MSFRFDDDDPIDLIDFAKAWFKLGMAIREQVEKVLDLGDDAPVNPNAINKAQAALEGFNKAIDDALESWLRANMGDGDVE